MAASLTSKEENCFTLMAPLLKSAAAPPFQCSAWAAAASRNTTALFAFLQISSHSCKGFHGKNACGVGVSAAERGDGFLQR